MRRNDGDVGQTGQRSGATGTGPGTPQGGQPTGGTEQYSTTTTAGSRERGVPEQTGYPRGAPSEGYYGRAPADTGAANIHGGLFLAMAGLLTFLVGLAFVVRHSFYHSIAGYAYNWGIASWGWVLFGLGIATFAVGVSHLLDLPMTRPLGIVMSILTIVAGFMVIPFYPFWGIIILALGIAALWGLAHGAERESRKREIREYERERQRM